MKQIYKKCVLNLGHPSELRLCNYYIPILSTTIITCCMYQAQYNRSKSLDVRHSHTRPPINLFQCP